MAKRPTTLKVNKCSDGLYRLLLHWGSDDEELRSLRCMYCLEDFNNLVEAEAHEDNARRDMHD